MCKYMCVYLHITSTTQVPTPAAANTEPPATHTEKHIPTHTHTHIYIYIYIHTRHTPTAPLQRDMAPRVSLHPLQRAQAVVDAQVLKGREVLVAPAPIAHAGGRGFLHRFFVLSSSSPLID